MPPFFISFSFNIFTIALSLAFPSNVDQQPSYASFFYFFFIQLRLDDVIISSIKWKSVENIHMYTHGPLTNNSSKVFEMSILGLPWFVLKESVVATSTDSKGVQYGLFANRVFKKDDLLRVYLGVILQDLQKSHSPYINSGIFILQI